MQISLSPPQTRKAVLLEGIHDKAKAGLEAAGFTVELHPRAYQGAALVEVIGDAALVGIRSKTHLTSEVLAGVDRLCAIGCFCIGTNQVDLSAAAARGMPVFNAPFSNTRSVAELVIAEVIMLHRRLFDRSAAMHRGEWRKSAVGSHEIRGRTLGIVGYGRIGSQVSVLAEARSTARVNVIRKVISAETICPSKGTDSDTTNAQKETPAVSATLAPIVS